MAFNTDNLTSDEIIRATWLRAVEWVQWPAFVSQPLLPILAIFVSPWKIFVGIVVCGYLWMLVRYRFVSYQLAVAGCLWVRLKWPVGLVMTIYFIIERRWTEAVFSICNPLVVLAAMGLIRPTGQFGLVQKSFWKQIGFDPDATSLNEILDKMKTVMHGG
jgi:hypothetical protein